MFIYKNLNRKMKNETMLFELLNAIGILENQTWKDMYQLYVDVLLQEANGPSEDSYNIKSILKDTGYTVLYDHKKFNGYALLRRGEHFYAFVQEGKELNMYGITDPKHIDTFEDYHMYVKTFDYSYDAKIRQTDTMGSYFNNHKSFNYTNQNPLGKVVGDCSIRAISEGLHIEWKDALNLLAQEGYKSNELHFNNKDIVEKILAQHGFTKYKYFPIKLTCKEFCEKMNQMYTHSDILVYCGLNHITALQEENHKYVIKDTWDCSNELAGEYFVRKKDENKKEKTDYVGRIVIHPVYKEGLVMNQDNRILTISFNECEKKISLDWVLDHCEFIEE